MISSSKVVIVLAAISLIACNREQRANIDSTAGNVTSTVKNALSVIDIDMGRHADSAAKITDKTDNFTPKDTIYASVHTSGTATNGAVVGRWTFQDGSVIDEQTHNVTTNGDAYTAFHIAKPGGFAKGKYTIHILIDGNEVRTKDVEVK